MGLVTGGFDDSNNKELQLIVGEINALKKSVAYIINIFEKIKIAFQVSMHSKHKNTAWQ